MRGRLTSRSEVDVMAVFACRDVEAVHSHVSQSDYPLVFRWKTTMTDYFDRMNALGIRLTRLLAVGLGMDPYSFEGYFSKSMSALRLLHYSAEVYATLLFLNRREFPLP